MLKIDRTATGICVVPSYVGLVFFSAVPEPTVTPIVGNDGLVPIQSPDSFTLSFLIEVDPAVDIPVDVETVWKEHPSLLDKPRVTVQPTPSNPPYLTSLVFDSIKPKDFGDYGLSVVLGVRSREGVINSDAVDVSMTFSLGNNITQKMYKCPSYGHPRSYFHGNSQWLLHKPLTKFN